MSNIPDRMTASEYREYRRTGRLPGDKAARSKYGNKKTSLDGTVYDSGREANRAAELKLMVQAREVIIFFEQVPFLLPGGRKYIADFVILWPDGAWTVEDAKGVRTDVYKIKRDLMCETYGIKIVEVK
jgi:hypothetical protein